MIHRAGAAAAIAAFLCCIVPAQAQSVRLVGDFRDWSAYSAAEGAGQICFVLTKPLEVTPPPDGYGQASLYPPTRPAESVRNEFNLVAGFAFAPDQPATISVSGQAFELFTENDAAWLLDPAQGNNLASAIRAGSSLVVDGTSAAGLRIQQIYSLSGATAATRAIEGGC